MALAPHLLKRKAEEKNRPKVERKPSVINPRHKLVADAVMEGHSESDAMRAAGYHPTQATQVMRSENVQQILAEAREEVEDLTTIKRLDVLNIMVEAIDMARTLADPANMINGADKIAKMMGYYAPETKRIELTTDQSVFHSKLRALSDAELMEIAAGRARVITGETVQ